MTLYKMSLGPAMKLDAGWNSCLYDPMLPYSCRRFCLRSLSNKNFDKLLER